MASPLSGAAIVEVDTGAGVVLLGRIDKEVTSMELVGVGGGDEVGGRDSRLGGDEADITIELVREAVEKVEELAFVLEEKGVDGDERGRDGRPEGDEVGITIELVSEVVEKAEELAMVLEAKDVDGDGELGLNCSGEDIGEGEMLELSGKVGTDGIEIGGKNELDRVSELGVWAELDDIPELDDSIELDTATVLDETAEPDRSTELENAPGLENGDVGNGLVDNAEPDTSTELGGKAEPEAGTVFEYNAELDAAVKLEV